MAQAGIAATLRWSETWRAFFQPWKNALHVSLHLSVAAIPACAISQWGGVTFATNHDHRILIGLRFGHVAAHNLVESLREKLITQVVSVEGDGGDGGLSRLFVGP